MSQTAHSHTSAEAAEACPYCGQEITHDEFLEIKARIAKDQKEIFQEQMKAHEKQLNAKHLAETSELHKKLAAKEEAAAQQVEAARKAEREKVEKEQTKAAVKLVEDREALEIERKKMSAEKEVREKGHKDQLENVRKVMEADTEKKLLAQKADSDKSTYKLKQKLEDATRQLEKQSNEELGDGAEVDLYVGLKKAFPDDLITRVKKGVAGADIKHEVHVDGRYCGKVVYDSKNRNNWKFSYAEQLRKDQLAEEADHAILATRKFPANTREMTGVNGVLLVNPARAVVLAGVIRESLIRLSTVKLSEQGKKDKQHKLYEFIMSANCENLFKRVADEVENLRKLDIKEKTQQEKMRGDRAKHVGEVEKTVLGTLRDELHKIIGV